MTLDDLELHALDLVVKEAIKRHDEGEGSWKDKGVLVWKMRCSVCRDKSCRYYSCPVVRARHWTKRVDENWRINTYLIGVDSDTPPLIEALIIRPQDRAGTTRMCADWLWFGSSQDENKAARMGR